eukprot:COSAG01_NODE_6070_length_3867_cov_10.430806_1_plen_77_part_00
MAHESPQGGWGRGGCSIPAAMTVTILSSALILPCNAPAARRPPRCDSPPLHVAQAAAASAEEASRQLSAGGASDGG